MECCGTDSFYLTRAAEILAQGALVAFPTETVYGLGGDAECDAAIAAIYALKGRPAHNPLIVHVADVAMARRYGVLNEAAEALAASCWPGALTLVVDRVGDCKASPLVSPGMATVALRVPSHPIALELIKKFGRGIAAPSANRSGRISPTTAAHVAEEFASSSGGLAMILDGGPTQVGIESTVADCRGEGVRILRHGSISEEKIQKITGKALGSGLVAEGKALLSPGMLASHYAPRAKVRLNAQHIEPGEALLAFGPQPLPGAAAMRNLSTTGDLEEAARHLYAFLRELDASGCARIAVMPLPGEGIGAAINDRLRRAAAPRS